ncbi:MAG: FGGY family carbohydrate kinase [Chloroflexota bacterium]
MDITLGLDLGTTNCKVLALDTQGQQVASATAPTPVHPRSTDPSSPEYEAIALWELSGRLIREVLAQLTPEQRVAGLAVTSMAEAGVLLDAAGQALFPILTWHDRRTQPWRAWWGARLTQAEIYGITGLPLDHIYSVNKILWQRDFDPFTFARAQTWLCLADWITFCLTGERATSFSQASRTMLFDIRGRAWSDDLLRLAGLAPALMPPALPSGQIVGRVTAGAAGATGLPAGTPVVSGGHDHICAALAAGVVAPGPVLDSAGTAEAILFPLDAPILTKTAADAGVCCGHHTVRDRYYLVGGVMSGAVTGWLGRLLAGDASAATLAGLMDEAMAAPLMANGVWFLPYLGGSGPPDRDPAAWGAWLGLRLKHSRADLMRAAMEGLAFAVRYLLEGLQGVTGSPITELRAVGGGSRHPWWQSLKADVLGLPVETPAVTDVTAQGAALLAGIGVGLYRDATEAAALAHRPARRFEPDPARHAVYDQAYHEVYLKLYPTLQGLPLGEKVNSEQ